MARRITTGASSSRGPGSLAVRAIHAVTRIVDHTGSRVPRKAANRRRSAGGPGPFHTVLRDLDDPTLILGAYDGGSARRRGTRLAEECMRGPEPARSTRSTA